MSDAEKINNLLVGLFDSDEPLEPLEESWYTEINRNLLESQDADAIEAVLADQGERQQRVPAGAGP